MIASIILIFSVTLSVQALRRLPHEENHAPKSQIDGRRRLLDHHDHDQETLFRQSSRVTASGDKPDPDSHLVTSLPLLPDGLLTTKHWAGHLPAAGDGSDKKIFYWLFEPGENAGNTQGEIPLVLWLNGGPGCSSMDGLWLENGPLRLVSGDDGWKIDVNPHSWHNAPAWTLYVDQPVGTGLSFTRKRNYCKNDFEVNRDFHYFLEEFFLLHRDKFLALTTPQSKSSAKWTLKVPFYFSGESHAGHYIPSMIDFILQRNDGEIVPSDSNGLAPLRVSIACRGAAIGNGWIDPYHQYAAAEAAYGAGLIGTAQRASLQDEERECQSKLKSGNYRSNVCFGLLDNIINQSGGKNGRYKVSQYDTRIWESRVGDRTFPMGHKDLETYLGGAPSRSKPPLKVDHRLVLKAIHATEASDAGLTYEECTDPPYFALKEQDGLGVVEELTRVLDHETKPHMLFFNGINDLICNHVGNDQVLDALPWSKTSQYTQQPRHAWESGVEKSLKMNYIPGRPDGYIKQFDNLSYLKVLESGHMVPMDQPAVALVMMKTLVYGTGGGKSGFLSSEQNLARADTSKEARMCKLDECPGCKIPEPGPSDDVVPMFSIGTVSPVSLINFGVLIASFALGVILTALCQRYLQRASARRVLASVDEDMELTDQDSLYRDRVCNENGEYS